MLIPVIDNITWDDDINICMHRDDFKKLLNLLESNDVYRVATVFDSLPLCLQHRFCLKDENVSSLINIGGDIKIFNL